jgi:hypothetical protein
MTEADLPIRENDLMLTDDATCTKSTVDKLLLKRPCERIEKLLPNEKQSRIEQVCEARTLDTRDILDPALHAFLRLQVDPKLTYDITLKFSPILAHERIDSVEPSIRQFRILTLPDPKPMFPAPMTLKLEPSLTNDLTDSELPISTNLKIDMLLPPRDIILRLKVLPKDRWSTRLILLILPILIMPATLSALPIRVNARILKLLPMPTWSSVDIAAPNLVKDLVDSDEPN